MVVRHAVLLTKTWCLLSTVLVDFDARQTQPKPAITLFFLHFKFTNPLLLALYIRHFLIILFNLFDLSDFGLFLLLSGYREGATDSLTTHYNDECGQYGWVGWHWIMLGIMEYI